MKLSRIGFCLAGWLWVCPGPARAQDAWMPYVIGRQYSATEEVSSQGTAPVESRIYVEDGKIRTETAAAGSKVVAIIRPDLQTVYWVIVARRQLLVLPFDVERIKKQLPPQAPMAGRSEQLGLETIGGIICSKCRLTNASGKTFLLWTDAVRNTPLKISAEDGDYMLLWKDYRAGPQDPGLFVPPDDYRDVEMPLPPSLKLPAPVMVPPEGLGK